MTNRIERELGPVQNVFQAKSRGIERAEIQKMARNGEIDCDACKKREAQEKPSVSVTPAPAAPKASADAVKGQGEQQPAQHQSSGGHSRSQSATCTDCGRVYVSGGEDSATTQIKYNEENPYAQGFKIADSAVVAGQNMDMEI